MKPSKQFLTVVSAVTLLHISAAYAARVDMNDPRRALGREDDIRIDAQLLQDTVASGSPVGVTYQVQNLTSAPIALADKVCDVSFDSEEGAVVVAIGSEVPKNGEMPKLVVIAPGEKKTFSAGGVLRVTTSAGHSALAPTPHVVQIKVNILRNLGPFEALIARQARATTPIGLNDAQFETWIESNDTIFLNTIPVRYDATARSTGVADASRRTANAAY